MGESPHIPPFTNKLRLFISYSRSDRPFIKELAEWLESDTYDYEVWFDGFLRGGEEWWVQILEEINRCDVFIFILSPTSIKSISCLYEYKEAVRLHKPVVPVLIRQKRLFGKKIVNLPQDLTQLLKPMGAIQAVDMTPGIIPQTLRELRRAIDECFARRTDGVFQDATPTPLPKQRHMRDVVLAMLLVLQEYPAVAISIVALLSVTVAYTTLGNFAALFTPPTSTPEPHCIVAGFRVTDINDTVLVIDEYDTRPGYVLFIEPEVSGCNFSSEDYIWQIRLPVEQIARTVSGISYIAPNAAEDEITLRLPPNAGVEQATLKIHILQS
jgi:hypothetical protein